MQYCSKSKLNNSMNHNNHLNCWDNNFHHMNTVQCKTDWPFGRNTSGHSALLVMAAQEIVEKSVEQLAAIGTDLPDEHFLPAFSELLVHGKEGGTLD
ncbi:uncharacterized protein LOC123507787 isoform X2 [Portunus trituberculatus]|nr:uncharacterized protein LOC123507787 isoform X2 [Portunus trituberculatus]XP_045116924.1 uncharacterized protein LOC123507787 isoform X2 [Portunus trituberculatus]